VYIRTEAGGGARVGKDIGAKTLDEGRGVDLTNVAKRAEPTAIRGENSQDSRWGEQSENLCRKNLLNGKD